MDAVRCCAVNWVISKRSDCCDWRDEDTERNEKRRETGEFDNLAGDDPSNSGSGCGR